MSAADQLERLYESLLRNAEGFRKWGHEECALQSESIAARLRAAIDKETQQ